MFFNKILISVLFTFFVLTHSRAGGIKFEPLNEFPSRHAFAVIKDSYGFMWIGCEGVIRYDGYEMRSYNENSNPYSYEGITCEVLFEDSKTNLWAGGIQGISRYDREKDEFIFYDSSKSSINKPLKFTQSIVEDVQGVLWISTLDGLFKFNEAKDIFEHIPLYNELGEEITTLTTLCIDKSGLLWIGNAKAQLYTYNFRNGQIQTVYSSSTSSKSLSGEESIHCIYEDSRGYIWVTGTKITFYIDPDSGSINWKCFFQNTIDHNSSILEDNDGNIWLGAGETLIYYPEKDSSYTLNLDDNYYKSTSVKQLYLDDDGIMWVAGWNGGIQRYIPHKKRFKHYSNTTNTNKSLSGSLVYDFYEDKTGKVWICSEGLNVFNPQTEEFIAHRADPDNDQKLYNETLLSICEGNENELFVGAYGALHNINMSTGTVKRYFHDTNNYNSIGGDYIYDLVKGDNNNVWIGISKGEWAGLDEMDLSTGKITHHSMRDGCDSCKHWNSSVNELYKDTKGNIWILSWHELYRFHIKSQCFHHYIHDPNNPYKYNESSKDNISPGRVYCCFQDSKERLWVGTATGINLYDYETERFFKFGHEQGMAGQSVLSIQEDDKGNLWMATEKGLSKFCLPAALDVIKSDMTFTDSISNDFIYFYNYGENDGLLKGEFLNASLKARDGTLYFGGTNGFNCFKPDEIKQNHQKPVVKFTEFSLANQIVRAGSVGNSNFTLMQDITVAKKIELSYNQDVFGFKWAALNYKVSEKNRYAYIMEGFEKEWNYAGLKREATYANLLPGEYTFRVKACNNDGLWNDKDTSIAIHILPPWWQTWFFRISTVLLVILIIIGTFLIRVRILKKHQKVLESEVAMRTISLIEANSKLSEQKLQVEKQNIQIKKISEELHEADEEKLRFFTNISHEFRTPITLILGHLESLSNNKTNSSVKTIRNSALRLLDMINQLIEIRKIDNGSAQLSISCFDVVEVTEQIVENFKVVASKKEINLRFYSCVEKLLIWLDQEKMTTILNNLISNAIKFTSNEKSILVNLYQRDKNFIIEVQDEGIGISEDTLPFVFDRFYRGDNLSQQGHGIGLNYVKQLVDLQHGSITADSKAGVGTCFSLNFKKGNTHFNKKDIVDTSMELPKNETVSYGLVKQSLLIDTAKVLLVEDNYELSEYISNILNQHFMVEVATNGKEAFEKLENMPVDIIISDIMMPVMDGLEFCRTIKSKIEFSHIPFILLTAKTDINTQIEGFTNGVDDFITKPFSSELLLARIKALLSNRENLKTYFKSTNSKVVSEEKTISKQDKAFWSNFLKVIEGNYNSVDFNAEDIAKKMNMSNTAFYRKFKSLTGQGAAEYLRTYRIHKAAELLRENEYTIKQIVCQVGLKGTSQFRVNFKDHFGKTPSKYLKEMYY